MITETMMIDHGAPKLPGGYKYRVKFPSDFHVEVYVEKRSWLATSVISKSGLVFIHEYSNRSYDDSLMDAIVKAARTAYSGLEEELSAEFKRQKRSAYSGTVR